MEKILMKTKQRTLRPSVEATQLMANILLHHVAGRKEQVRAYDPNVITGEGMRILGKTFAAQGIQVAGVGYGTEDLVSDAGEWVREECLQGVASMELYNALPFGQQWTSSYDVAMSMLYQIIETDIKAVRSMPRRDVVKSFVENIMEQLAEDGIAVVMVPPNRTRVSIIPYLLQHNYLDGVITLPAGAIARMGFSWTMLVLKKNRTQEEFFLVDARVGAADVRTVRRQGLGEDWVERITDIYTRRQEIPGMAKIITYDMCRDNRYGLHANDYFGVTERVEEKTPLRRNLNGMEEELRKLRMQYMKVIHKLKSAQNSIK